MVEKSIELLLSHSTLKGERRKGKEKTLQKLLQDIAEMSDEPQPLEKSHDLSRKFVRKLVPELKQPHTSFPALSQAVAVQYDPKGVRGRYCVASRDIEPGELLAVETPFVWLLDKEAAKEHCWHCFRSLLAPVPCPNCAGIMFCGPECRDEALKTYHKYECGITDVIHKGQIGGWALAFRAITTQPYEFYDQNRKRFSKRNELLGSKNHDNEVYESTSIWSFHNLVTHQGSDKQAPELMMQSLAAIFLLRCLKAKNYYPIEPNADPKRLSEEELYLSLLIHHFMRVTYYNTHEITTTDEDTNGVGFGTDRLAMRRIGRATNPTLALLNHTCDPNYRRISVGRQTLGFATKLIKAGEEITDTYCPTFAAIPKGERLQSLAKYNFVCNCTPCREDWPTLDQLPR
eukprot:03709.XXX_1099_2702_1 [CDS] Oithona nana genome sequencing.